MNDTSTANKQRLDDRNDLTESIMTKIGRLRTTYKHMNLFTEKELDHLSFCLGAVWMEQSSQLKGDLKK
jgi:hypothetical protein